MWSVTWLGLIIIEYGVVLTLISHSNILFEYRYFMLVLIVYFTNIDTFPLMQCSIVTFPSLSSSTYLIKVYITAFSSCTLITLFRTGSTKPKYTLLLSSLSIAKCSITIDISLLWIGFILIFIEAFVSMAQCGATHTILSLSLVFQYSLRTSSLLMTIINSICHSLASLSQLLPSCFPTNFIISTWPFISTEYAESSHYSSPPTINATA